MPKAEFDALVKTGQVKAEGFTGIAPNHAYSKGYVTNTSDATHLVEFRPDAFASEPVNVYDALTKRGFTIKAEGGGTFGLGSEGAQSSKHDQAVRDRPKQDNRAEMTAAELDALKTPSDLMTEWVASGQLRPTLVDVRLPGKGDAKQKAPEILKSLKAQDR